MEATERGDANAMVRLLRADAFCAMPPDPSWWVGNWEIVDAWVQGGFGDDDWGTLRRRHERQPAAGGRGLRQARGRHGVRPLAVDVLRIEDGVVGEITVFSLDEKLLEALGLPPTL